MHYTVYACSDGELPVKIMKRGSVWAVFELRRITQVNVIHKDPEKKDQIRYRVEWNEKPCKVYGYKPYKDKDVYITLAKGIIEHTKRWFPYLVSWHIPTSVSPMEALGWLSYP